MGPHTFSSSPSMSTHALWEPNLPCLSCLWMGLQFTSALPMWLVLHTQHLGDTGRQGRKEWEHSFGICVFMGTTLNVPFSPETKSQSFKTESKGSYFPSYLEEECKCQQPLLPVGPLEVTGTCRARLQCHHLLQKGPRQAKESERGREEAGMCLPTACLRTSSFFPKASCETLKLCLRKKRARQRERKVNYWEKQISLWELGGQQKHCLLVC